MNIYLIGYRCTGKTRVGKALARLLERDFVDTDAIAVAEAGMPIRDMVARNGWSFFRRLEQRVLSGTIRRKNCVVATGGGVVLDPENVRLMRIAGQLVWLKATPETIRRRMADDQNTGAARPSLSGAGALEEIEAVLAARKAHYRRAADFAVDTDDVDPQALCRDIAAHLAGPGCLPRRKG